MTARIGAFTAACVLVSNAVGSGVFTTTGFMARDLGSPPVILALWLAGGVLALAGALAYAELGAAMPRSGGEYVYLRRAYGPVWGFLTGWTSLTLGFGAAIAAAAMSVAGFLETLVPDLFADSRAPAIGLVWALTAAHSLGTRGSGPLQQVLTIAKIGGIFALFGLAAWAAGTSDGVARGVWLVPDVDPSAPAIAVSLIFVLYAYSGWNAAGYIAGELARPARDLPRALACGTLFVTLLYIGLNGIYLWALPVSELAAEPVLPVAEKVVSSLLGDAAGGWLAGLLCVSIAGAASAMTWVGPRVYREMAADGELPTSLAAQTASGAPVRALVLQAVWVTLLVATGSFEQILVYAGVALAIWSAMAVLAVVVLRVREPEMPRPFRMPLSPWLPMAYVAAAFWIAGYSAWARPTEALLSLGTIALGLPIRALTRRSRLPGVAKP